MHCWPSLYITPLLASFSSVNAAACSSLPFFFFCFFFNLGCVLWEPNSIQDLILNCLPITTNRPIHVLDMGSSKHGAYPKSLVSSSCFREIAILRLVYIFRHTQIIFGAYIIHHIPRIPSISHIFPLCTNYTHSIKAGGCFRSSPKRSRSCDLGTAGSTRLSKSFCRAIKASSWWIWDMISCALQFLLDTWNKQVHVPKNNKKI